MPAFVVLIVVIGGLAIVPFGHSPSASRASMTWPTISPGVRLRTSRIVPVWQNRQLSVQPTWLETHKRAAILIGDEDHFVIMRVVGAQQPFAGAVGANAAPRPLPGGR